MQLTLTQLPETILGSYESKSKNRKDYLPEVMRKLVPEAAKSYLDIDALGVPLQVSDMFRTPEMSFQAMQRKSGVQPPGYSGHNFGMSIDVCVGACLKRFKMTKKQFDEFMESHGWTCHRLDHERGSEDWHYNHNVRSYMLPGDKLSMYGLERKIQDKHKLDFDLSVEQMQEYLKKMKLYNGDIDGKLGPLTSNAIQQFQAAWKLSTNNLARTKRVMAVVNTEVVFI